MAEGPVFPAIMYKSYKTKIQGPRALHDPSHVFTRMGDDALCSGHPSSPTHRVSKGSEADTDSSHYHTRLKGNPWWAHCGEGEVLLVTSHVLASFTSARQRLRCCLWYCRNRF